MSRQLLPRQRSEAPARARAGFGSATSVAPTPAGSARPLRRPAVLALVAGATAVLAGLAWTLVRAPGEASDQNASVLVRPRTPAAAAPTPTPTATGDSAGDAPAGAAGRDPFGGEPAGLEPSTRPPSDDLVSGTAAPTPAGTSPLSAAPTSAPTTAPTGAPAPVTVTATATTTVTRTASPTATPTVTMTAPGSAVYVGFYLWNGERASFRVNTRTYSKPVGSTFGPQLTFTSIVKGTPRCAKLRYQGSSFTLCPGQVVRLP